MNARNLAGGMLGIGLLLAGCHDVAPLAPLLPDATLDVAPAATPVRPLKGHLAGTSAPGAQCGSEPWEVMLYVQGEGMVSHLGRTSLRLEACWNMLASTPVGPVTAAFTAASGDEVWMRATTFEIDPATGVMTADYTVEGGTGRLEQARGSLTVTGQHYPDFTWTSEATGWLAY